MIIEKINKTFGGDYNDKTPLHKNSLCRIAYCGYLKNRGLKTRQIVAKTNFIRQEVCRRTKTHRELYQFNPEYKQKFDSLFDVKI